MPLYFDKYKTVDGTFVTISIKNQDISVGITVTEEEFLIFAETVKIRKPGYVVSMDGR